MLRRPAPRGAYNRIRAEQIEQIHPLLEQLKPSLNSSLALIDDYGQTDAFDLLLKLLPTVDAAYLPFDVAIVDDLLHHFRCPSDTEELQVIPSYWSEWQNYRMFYLMHTEAGVGRRDLTFIRIQRDARASPRLDDMIWMGHEIGHHLFVLNAVLISQLFEPYWLRYQTEVVQANMSARGRTLDLANERRGLMEQFWHPNSTESNWTHELLIDTLCLWVFGPAYLWAFVEAHIDEPESYEPHQMDMHPPLRLRAEAMRDAAAELGWDEAKDIEPLLNAWQPTPTEASAANKYLSFRRPYLIEGTRQVAIALAVELEIPKLSPEEWRSITPELAFSSDISARDLIVAAWKLRAADCPMNELETWEDQVVSSTLSALPDAN